MLRSVGAGAGDLPGHPVGVSNHGPYSDRQSGTFSGQWPSVKALYDFPANGVAGAGPVGNLISEHER